MNLLLKLVSCFLAALVLGLGSAWWFIDRGLGGAVQNGAWGTDPAIGSVGADPYTRARVARAGLLALDKIETAYFTAIHDDTGAPLSTACNYKVEGRALATRWWSITAYGADHYLIANEAKQYSQAMNTVTHNTDGHFTIMVGPASVGRDAIPTGFSGQGTGDPFSLTLRLYNPTDTIHDHLDTVSLPTITKERC